MVNAAEGEPASLKDRTLCQSLPHLVLDGAQLAAQAVGADEVIVCVCESALREHPQHHRGDRRTPRASMVRAVRTQVSVVPSHYVAGQESALVNHLNGGPAKPTFTPPMPFEQGVRRRPTLVNNAETLAHVALIARHGSDWFRGLGTPAQPGSALVTLSGPVAHPGVYEIEHGASLSSLIDAAGGTTAGVRGALLGGYAGAWIAGDLLGGVALSGEHLAPHGASLGAGVVLLLSEDACPVAETARVARWLAAQSTGQCGPCVNGLDALAGTVEEIAAGTAQAQAEQRMRAWLRSCDGAEPAGIPTEPSASSPAPWARSPPTSPTTPVTDPARRASPTSCRSPSHAGIHRPRAGPEHMSHRLRVNPIACEAHGMCAELLPERITLDEWGYPIVDESHCRRELVDHARRAAQACPTFALLLERERSRA